MQGQGLTDLRCNVRREAAADLGVVELHKHQRVRTGRLSDLDFGTNARRPIRFTRGQNNLLRAQTQGIEPGLPLPVVITAFADKSFTFVIKSPPSSILIKKAVKIDKGSARPQADKVGKITRAQLEEIAKTKMKDLTAADMDAAVRTIAGSARSMGVIVEGV